MGPRWDSPLNWGLHDALRPSGESVGTIPADSLGNKLSMIQEGTTYAYSVQGLNFVRDSKDLIHFLAMDLALSSRPSCW